MAIKSNRVMIILTSFICLLPIIFSFIVYSDLPEQIVVQWDNIGNPTNYISKAYAAFGLPLFFLAVNIFSKLRLYNDPKRSNTSKVMQIFSTWTPPFLSLIIVPTTLYIAMGANIPIPMIVRILIGIILILGGNYLPKSRQNYTIGIKNPWTLSSSDNWNKTHRLAGYLWILGGIILTVSAFIATHNTFWSNSMPTLIIALLIIIPFLYSYFIYKRTSDNKQDDNY